MKAILLAETLSPYWDRIFSIASLWGILFLSVGAIYKGSISFIREWKEVQLAKSNNEARVKALELEEAMIRERLTMFEAYIKDNDKDKRNYSEMLEDMKEAQKQNNEILMKILTSKIL